MALIPLRFFNCVVALGVDNRKDPTAWLGTGFFFGELLPGQTPQRPEDLTGLGSSVRSVFLVSNRHVFEGLTDVAAQSRSSGSPLRTLLRLNPRAGNPAQQFEIEVLESNGARRWFPHPDPKVDVAVMAMNFTNMQAAGAVIDAFHADTDSLEMAGALQRGVCEGDAVYVMGFPQGLIGDQRNYVIVRGGIIAHIQDTLAGAASDFLIDAAVFPGNSGGPVIRRINQEAIQDTSPVLFTFLLGIVKSYIPYEDVAISQQTQLPRVIFQENSGLAAVEPVDHIRATIRALINSSNPPTPSSPTLVI